MIHVKQLVEQQLIRLVEQWLIVVILVRQLGLVERQLKVVEQRTIALVQGQLVWQHCRIVELVQEHRQGLEHRLVAEHRLVVRHKLELSHKLVLGRSLLVVVHIVVGVVDLMGQVVFVTLTWKKILKENKIYLEGRNKFYCF